jgi:alkyl hydroperoxide reductase subunit F
MYDLIILGGGPAGLTATVYALRKRLNALLITRDLGGKTNYRLQLPFVEKHLVITGMEVVSHFANEVEYLEFAREFDKVETVEQIKTGFRVSTRGGKTHEARVIIVATGARGRLLNVPGEKEFMMRGLCYSAVSYAPLFIEREVVVIGDTKLALRSTAELARTEAEMDSLSRVAARLRDDPEAIERVARERYGMIREGEILYRFHEVPPRDESAIDSAQERK